jgi:Na+-driven multidrug efflux pump
MPDTAATTDVTPELAAPSRGGFWSLVRESLRGARHDFTSLPLGRAILLLAVPMVLEMAMESIFAVADVFWVAKLGADAIATVMFTESMLIIIYAFAMGLAMGAAAIVARRIGEKDPHGAARAAVQAIGLGLGLAVVVGTIGSRRPGCCRRWALHPR